MYKEMPTFEEIAASFEPLIKSQIKKLRIYKDHEHYYQSGLIGLWEAYSRFDPEKGDFPAFALRTVRGTLLTELRKASRYDETNTPIDETVTASLVDTKGDVPLDTDYANLYCEGLSARELLWVKEAIFQQKKQSEIAAEYGVSPETVKTWRKGALKKLRVNAVKIISGKSI